MKRLLFCLSFAACLLFSLQCNRAGRETASASSSPAAQDAAPPAPLTVFPPLGPAKRVERGVVVHKVSLGHGDQAGRIWIYLPEKMPAKPIPCVFIAPAGVAPFLGNGFGTDLALEKHPEHLPYVHAGFAVVAYDVDGEVPNLDNMTYEQVQTAATAFKNAEAGVLNARHAIDYVLKMVPGIDPKRLYSAGHSSAGRIALIVAESDPRIAACAAYAPVTNPELRIQQNAPDAGKYLESNLPGFRDFLKRTSPVKQIERLRCPTFLFHAEDDSVISIIETESFAETLKKTNPRVTFVRAERGDHYDSMVEEGVPQAIRWLRDLQSQ